MLSNLTQEQSKAIASFVCMAIADAMGSQIEFQDFNPQGLFKMNGWEDIINYCNENHYQRCEFGIYSDDTSMGRCIADSLLANEFSFQPKDLMYRFILWWNFGYNNGSRCNGSFGLGGNISISFINFCQNQNNYQFNNFGNNSGNGSVMRLAPVPVCFYNNIDLAMKIAGAQSMVTHNGIEAYHCCRLLAFIICKLICYEGNNPKRDILDKLGEQFQCKNCDSVLHLAKSEQEPNNNYNKSFNKVIEDRNWDWKSQTFIPSPTRFQDNSGYFGSYVMDCMKIALHIVYHTNSLQEAIFKAVSMGGDCDSFGSVVGQIAGAMYGLDQQIINLYCEKMAQYENYSSFVKAYKLVTKNPCSTKFKLIKEVIKHN